jgi:hypothetical protein
MKYSTLLKNTLVGCVYIGVFAFAPLSFNSDDGILSYHAAYAKGGNGGGNSNSSGKSSDSAGVSAKSNGNPYGYANDGLGSTRGSFASELGRLNAAHASENALAHASANSVVGALAQYKTAAQTTIQLTQELQAYEANIADLNHLTPEQQATVDQYNANIEASMQKEADTLATAANKQVTDEVVTATRSLLDIQE